MISCWAHGLLHNTDSLSVMVMLSDTSFSNVAPSKASTAPRLLTLLTNHFLKLKSEFRKLRNWSTSHLISPEITESSLTAKKLLSLDFFFESKISPYLLPFLLILWVERKAGVNVIGVISHWESSVAGPQITECEAAIPHGALIAGWATQSRNCNRKFNMASQWTLIFIQMRCYWIHGSKASCIQMIDFFV